MDKNNSTSAQVQLTELYGAHNYKPLNVVLTKGQGAWVEDEDGKRYLDMLSAYSALNFGHLHPELVETARQQLEKISLTSRAFYNAELGAFSRDLAKLCSMEVVLPMVSGAEAVESAIKCARKWAYEIKGVANDQAEIITFTNNFHGRTIAIVSFSSEKAYRHNFGPYPGGFKVVPYGDIEAVKKAITKYTAGVLVEPIQGEGGVVVPPPGFLHQLRELCTQENVLLMADEIQTGLCRTGKTFCCQHENVQPDLYILGKALGGGIVPLSAVVGMQSVMQVFTPGTHGSTFGGNPLSCALGRKVIELVNSGKFQRNAEEQGDYLLKSIKSISSKKVKEVRGKGLMVGIEFKPEAGKANDYCYKLKELGLLCKDTREQTMRLAPALDISRKDLDWALERIQQVL